jgi:hypothetical protein
MTRRRLDIGPERIAVAGLVVLSVALAVIALTLGNGQAAAARPGHDDPAGAVLDGGEQRTGRERLVAAAEFFATSIPPAPRPVTDRGYPGCAGQSIAADDAAEMLGAYSWPEEAAPEVAAAVRSLAALDGASFTAWQRGETVPRAVCFPMVDAPFDRCH